LEYLNPVKINSLCQPQFICSLKSYWEWVSANRRSESGVFAVKAFFPQYVWAAREEPDLLPKLAFDDIIYLCRRDAIGQAISLFKARQTGAWTASATARGSADYSFEGIQTALRDVQAAEAGWERLFALTGSDPTRVWYEDVCDDVEGEVIRIRRAIGLSGLDSFDGEMPPMEIQRDADSSAWKVKFERDVACLDSSHFSGVLEPATA
jgi:LPS sulfotransferase NodH